MEEKIETNENSVKMQNIDKNNTIFTILKTSLLTMIACVVAVFYFFAVAFCLSPNLMIKTSRKMGWTGGEILGFQKVYEKSGKIEDLYNLTVLCIGNEKNKQIVKYVNELQDFDEYDEFCEKLDLSAIQNSKIQYVAYVGNLDSYLESQKVSALFKQGKKSEAERRAIANLKSENKFSFSLETYVECLKGNKEKLSKLANKTFDDKTVFEWIEQRISLLQYDSLADEYKALSIYTLLKINKTKYHLLEAVGNSEAMENVQIEISRLQNEYSSLMK